MKKLTIIAVVLAVGVTAGFASSLKVPWFVDTAPAANGVPGEAMGVTGLVTLTSNLDAPVTCAIAYYNAEGNLLGPFNPNNTFTIAPLSSLAFRPVADDPGTVAGGQEGAQGVLVPNRPRSPDTSTAIPGTGGIIDKKKNGSLVVTWVTVDSSSDVQGQVAYFQTGQRFGGIDPAGVYTMSYAHLLPPGT